MINTLYSRKIKHGKLLTGVTENATENYLFTCCIFCHFKSSNPIVNGIKASRIIIIIIIRIIIAL